MSKLVRGQRKLREARKLLTAVRDECHELRDETEEAIAATVRAEDRSAQIVRAAVFGRR